MNSGGRALSSISRPMRGPGGEWFDVTGFTRAEIIECIRAGCRKNSRRGRPESGPVVPVVTEFKKTVDEYKLTPDQYLRSSELREWARRNKNSEFILEPLVKAWGFELEGPNY
jgi:hypothetical protein